MLELEILPARYGDAILVTYGTRKKPRRILIDAGLSSVATVVADRLEQLDAHIDLFVITHVDLDHIGGAVKLLRDKKVAPRIGAVWFNGFAHVREFSRLLGPLDGERLSERIVQLGIPWNAGWPWPRNPPDDAKGAGGPVAVGDAPIRAPLPGGATAIVVSPTPAKMEALLPVWSEVIRKAALKKGAKAEPDEPDPRLRTLLGESLADVAGHKSSDDDAEANGSSIAFVLEVKDGRKLKRVLLGADAHPDVLVTAFEQLREPGEERYRLDLCKLPHHGSRRNVTKDWVEQLDCQRWVVSSNGVKFSHPNDEALARVIVHGTGTATIHGNYPNEFITSFQQRYRPDDEGYVMDLAPADAPGLVLKV